MWEALEEKREAERLTGARGPAALGVGPAGAADMEGFTTTGEGWGWGCGTYGARDISETEAWRAWRGLGREGGPNAAMGERGDAERGVDEEGVIGEAVRNCLPSGKA